MKKIVVAAAAGLAVIAAAAVAQDRGGGPFPGGPFRGEPGEFSRGPGGGGPGGGGPGGGWRNATSPADREAFTEARMAALHAGLRLNPDQEKLWAPVEEALRGLAKQRADATTARRERWASMREQDNQVDIPNQLRFMADRQAASADALRKLADASGPLYGSLDEAQKRRIGVLARMMRPEGHMGGRGGMEGGRRGWMRNGALEEGATDRKSGPRDFAGRAFEPTR